MTVPLWFGIVLFGSCGVLGGLLVYASMREELTRIDRNYWRERACLDAYVWQQYRDILRFAIDRMDYETTSLVALRLERFRHELSTTDITALVDKD